MIVIIIIIIVINTILINISALNDADATTTTNTTNTTLLQDMCYVFLLSQLECCQDCVFFDNRISYVWRGYIYIDIFKYNGSITTTTPINTRLKSLFLIPLYVCLVKDSI